MQTKQCHRLLLITCFFAYAISYIGKYSYSTNIQNVITDLGVSKSQAGYVNSAFFFCYGAGQLINGLLCEKMNSKWTVSCALCLSAGITFIMFFLKDVYVMAALWGANGVILSVLWCHCIKLLATVDEEGYMAKSVTVMSLTLPAGIVSAYGVNALLTYLGVWKYAYILAFALLLTIGVLFFFAVNRIERNAPTVQTAVDTERAAKDIGKGTMFKVFGLAALPLCLMGVCVGLLRDGSSSWMPVLLTDTFAVSDYFSILLTLGLPLMGVFSAALAASLIKRTKDALTSCLLAGLPSVLVCLLLTCVFESSVGILVALFMALSITAYVIGNTLTAVMPLYYKDKLKSGQTAGVINAFIYLGSALSTLLLGGLVENQGWEAFMRFLFGCSVAVSVCAFVGRTLLRKKKEK